MWLPRNHRLVWRILEDEQVINLLYVGPKSPDLYEQLGLGRRLREADEVASYEIELDREAAESITRVIEQTAAGTV